VLPAPSVGVGSTIADVRAVAVDGRPTAVLGDGGVLLGNTPLLWSHTEAARSLHQLTRERIRHRCGTAAYRAWRIARYIRLRLSV